VRRRSLIAIVSYMVVALSACAPPVTQPPPGATGPSDGCGTTVEGPGTERSGALVVDGVERFYTITVPPNHVSGTTTPVPLVLDFHGLLEGTLRTHPIATQFSAKATANGFAVAFPIGQNNGFNWDFSARESNPDLRFVDALVAHLGTTMCIDRSRMYVTGLSNGAAFTSMLMCMRTNTFAAAAPVAGVMDLCAATDRDMPLVTFHGTADPILPYSGFADVPRAIASKYACDDPPTVQTLEPDPDPSTNGPITLTNWDCGGDRSKVESYVIGGGGHSWPGSFFFQLIGFVVGPTATSIDATDVIWDFFSRHHL